ncbi:hypothetical protein [Photobacterium kishitanii]|uniref:Uncharacterized protein n=1 Tax=Photobacterium kishitanii TaxID=318456 RepID=A0A2T3KM12_9GAMM|nr:hypothetical protein [Photobacterium kishitanii]PSV00735.1 hypothetical protein C9J27_06225 [Photobacterium kishitanii]
MDNFVIEHKVVLGCIAFFPVFALYFVDFVLSKAGVNSLKLRGALELCESSIIYGWCAIFIVFTSVFVLRFFLSILEQGLSVDSMFDATKVTGANLQAAFIIGSLCLFSTAVTLALRSFFAVFHKDRIGIDI